MNSNLPQLYHFVPYGPQISDPHLQDIFKDLPNSDVANASSVNFPYTQ